MNTMTFGKVFLIVFSVGILVSPPLSAQEPDPDDPIEREVARLRAKYPRVDDELFESYVGQIKKYSLYRVARALEAERVRPLVDEWSKKLGLSMRLQTVPFVQLHMNRDDSRVQLAGQAYRLSVDEVGVLEDVELVITLLEVWSDPDRGGKPDRRFAVPDSLLEELRFETVEVLELVHPLNRVLEKVEFGNSFFDVMQELCSLADIDFALTFDREQREALYMTLENVSVMAAMNLSAQVAGRQLQFQRVKDDGELELVGHAGNGGVDLDEIVYLDTVQRVKSRLEASETPLADPLELFRKKLFQEAKELKDTRLIVQVSPAGKKG